jgi:hypothetical protein
VIPSGPLTTTVAKALGMPDALKVIVVVPSATALTRTPVLVAPAPMVRLDSVVAMAVLPDVRLKVIPLGDGAGPESVAVRVPLFPAPTMVKVEGVMERIKPTVTVDVAEFRPVAETVTVVVPLPTPLTVTVVLDVVCPADIAIWLGDTVAMVGSLVVRFRNTVPLGAFTRLTGNGTELPGVTDTLAGTLISTWLPTVTFAVASVRFGFLAWITAEPGATPVTATVVVIAPAAIVAVDEPTVAALVLVELTLKVIPPKGAGPERVNVRFCVPVPVIAREAGEKLMLPVTCTDLLVEVYAGALAVMLAVPRFWPVTCGATAGCVCRAAMVTVAGETPTLGESLLKLTVTPPAGAATGRVTWNAADAPRFSDTPDGRPIGPALCTVMLAVAFVMLGEPAFAVMVVVPGLAPTTGTVAVVAPCAMVTVAGAVTTPVGLALIITEMADGACADNVSVRFSVLGPVSV